MRKAANDFQSTVVLNQLRYSGMMETVRIRRAGFPVRRTFDDFMFRYAPRMFQSTHDCFVLSHRRSSHVA